MHVIYRNTAKGEEIESNGELTCEEVLEFVRKLVIPGSTLITSLPSGMGLDFHVENDAVIWVEFYADMVSSAFVTMPVAEQIVRRSFAGVSDRIKENYADLISKWES